MCPVSTVVLGMRSIPVRSALLLGTALLATSCADPAGTGSAPSPSTTPSSAEQADAQVPDDGSLVLQVAYTGGFVPPRYAAARLPLVSVYADGRVITEGPVIAIHPGPALPNLQVGQVSPERVEDLVQLALDAGVGRDGDYGTPAVTDAPSTRITVITADGTQTSEVYGLMEGPALEGDDRGLTDRQTAARASLTELVEELTAAGGTATEPYVPDAVAAVVDYTPPAGGTPDDVATWPGPPLPGDALRTGTDLRCVTAEGESADAVLEAAADATVETVWQNPDGGRWALSLRPLLPHETGCADLPRT